MARYTVWTGVERLVPGRYRVTATATLADGTQRCAPETRAEMCDTAEAAHIVRVRLADELCRDLTARGGCVAEDTEAQARGALA